MDIQLLLPLLNTLRQPYATARGTTWRAALLLLPLLAAAPVQLPAAWGGGSPAGAAGSGGEGTSAAAAAAGQQQEGEGTSSAAAAAGQQQEGEGQPALAVRPPPSGTTEEDELLGQQVQAAAAQLASPDLQRSMAASIVLALGRMQLRQRLYDETALPLARFIREQLSTETSVAHEILPHVSCARVGCAAWGWARVWIGWGGV